MYELNGDGKKNSLETDFATCTDVNYRLLVLFLLLLDDQRHDTSPYELQ